MPNPYMQALLSVEERLGSLVTTLPPSLTAAMEVLWHSKIRTDRYFIHYARQNTRVLKTNISMLKEPAPRWGLARKARRILLLAKVDRPAHDSTRAALLPSKQHETQFLELHPFDTSSHTPSLLPARLPSLPPPSHVRSNQRRTQSRNSYGLIAGRRYKACPFDFIERRAQVAVSCTPYRKS
ncbi:hypothetical protein PLEOSDRAFT_1106098 [Pleurotus ostreatus PC15]|uniref:Uncharacterized protein n=1 Tax=Pleurotus ostreatus (strain PC15) TaxID=1137138 RepID=A0A067NAS8_PLEO1|nr:hypothetical protein PLEOSDRAFT_1106098 [Pleurotus ostreatus PC15]